MTRIIFISTLLLHFVTSANTATSEKLDYLFDLVDIKSSWEDTLSLELKKRFKDNPKLKFVLKEYRSQFVSIYNWDNIRDHFYNKFKVEYSSDEVNKLIAIYETPVMRKYVKFQNTNNFSIAKPLSKNKKIFENLERKAQVIASEYYRKSSK